MPRLNTELDLTEHSYDVGKARHRELIDQLLDSLPPYDNTDLLREILVTVVKLAEQNTDRGDLKILRTAVKELRYAFRVFDRFRGVRKVSVFGSARTPPEHPSYQAAVEFSRAIAARGWMVITGAGPGIMAAGNEGAGKKSSFGLNILLPFEQTANPFIDGDPKLINFKYFFTRKLFFVKETDAIVSMPGGMGTQDETFETMTLIQTGKDDPCPVVLLDEPNSSYWHDWERFTQRQLLEGGMISPADRSLYKIASSIDDAVEEIEHFYSRYHSQRYVHHRSKLVLRLNQDLSDAHLARLNKDFSDIVLEGAIERCDTFPEELAEVATADLPRITFAFNQKGYGRLRELIDAINA